MNIDSNPKAVVIHLCVTALSCCLLYIFFPLVVNHPSQEGTFAAAMYFSVMVGIISGPIIRKFVK